MRGSHEIGKCTLEWREFDGNLVVTMSGELDPDRRDLYDVANLVSRIVWCHRWMPLAVTNGDERICLMVRSAANGFPVVDASNALPLDRGLLRAIIEAEQALTENQAEEYWATIRSLYA